jgi:hypothetical protein
LGGIPEFWSPLKPQTPNIRRKETVATRRNFQQHQSGTLNVILHGFYLLEQDKKARQITAWIPKLDQHVYRAGNWLAEAALQPGHYQLEGVKVGGTGTFDPKRNLILKPPPRKPDDGQIHAKLIFPWPETITSLRVAMIPRELFKAPDDIVGERDRQPLATLWVFTYKYDSDANLKLADAKLKPSGGHYWEPVSIHNHVNLHVFAAEDHYEQPSLAVPDFGECAEMFGYRIRLLRSLLSGVRHTRPPHGVAQEETEGLAPRTLRMALLGRLFKQKGDTNQAWYGDEALDGDPLYCGFGIC